MNATILHGKNSKAAVSFPGKKFLIFLFLIYCLPVTILASHFRYGNISWTNTSGNTVVFRIQQGWRLSGNPFPGQTVVPGAAITTGTFEFGDGNYVLNTINVTSINTAEDWFFGEQTVTYTYTNAGNVTAFFESCCRIDNLENNPDGSYRIETNVNVGAGNSSPITTLTPVVNLSINNPGASFQLPAFDPNGSTLSYTLAIGAQAASGEPYVQPAGLTVSPSGVVTFPTTGKAAGELYTTQIIISDGVATVGVDFIIKMVPPGNPPVFDYTETPEDGTIFTINTQDPISFIVKASDPDDQSVSLSVIGTPTGAIFTTASGNPVSATFNWTPGSEQAGDYLIVFQATDETGLSALTSVRIHVISPYTPITLTETHTDASCVGNDGSIDLLVSGGEAPFTFSWSNNATTEDLSGLTPGIYSVTVTDNTNATQTLSVTIQNNCTCPITTYLGDLANYLFVFTNGTESANWQGSSKGFIGNVAVAGIQAKEKTSGTVPYAGTIYSDNSSLDDWQKIINANTGQGFSALNQSSLLANLESQLGNAFSHINQLTVTPSFENRSAVSLNNLNMTNGNQDITVINITSGFTVDSKIYISGDANDLFILRWDEDADFSNGYNGQVKFKSGGAIVPQGGLTAANFIHVAGDLNASGGGTNPPLPYPQGPRTSNGTGTLINGGSDWKGGGFFTGYWLTTGKPEINNFIPGEQPYGKTSDLSNAIFVGGWYSTTTRFSMTSGTSGVHVEGCSQTVSPRGIVNEPLIADNDKTLKVTVLSNPSPVDFTLHINGSSAEPVMIRVMDITGRVFSTSRLSGGDFYFRTGVNLNNGIYFAEVIQGKNRKIIKLVKVN